MVVGGPLSPIARSQVARADGAGRDTSQEADAVGAVTTKKYPASSCRPSFGWVSGDSGDDGGSSGGDGTDARWQLLEWQLRREWR